MLSSNQIVKNVKHISSLRITYREGGNGTDGTCDCVGLVMGTMDLIQKRKWPYHSSNWFARFMTECIVSIYDCDVLEGMVVFKTRDGSNSINKRYLKGGSCYIPGDNTDYYHIGVVTSVRPLIITHCTGGSTNGIKMDNTFNGWNLIGKIKGVDYMIGFDEFMDSYEHEEAEVFADSGKTVNLRQRPDSKSKIITKIPIYDIVTVIEKTSEWAHVTYKNDIGYMMTKFLKFKEVKKEEICQENDINDRLGDIETHIADLNEVVTNIQNSIDELKEVFLWGSQ